MIFRYWNHTKPIVGGPGVRLHATAGRGSSTTQRMVGLEVARGTEGGGHGGVPWTDPPWVNHGNLPWELTMKTIGKP